VKSTLNLDQFRSAFRAGGFSSILLSASGGQFFVTALPRSGGSITLATTHGNRPRAFRNPAKAIEVLHLMGAHRVEVDTKAWSPAQASVEGRKRPDTAERQRRAHQAAAHDAWFRQQVALAVEEADSPNAEWVSQEEVKRTSATQRTRWLDAAREKAAV
jgi:hypothetical protein